MGFCDITRDSTGDSEYIRRKEEKKHECVRVSILSVGILSELQGKKLELEQQHVCEGLDHSHQELRFGNY